MMGPGGGPGGGRLLHLLLLSSDLQLTDIQRDQIRGVLKDHEEKVGQAMKQVCEAKKNLFKVAHEADADEQAIREAASKLGRAIGDAAVIKSKMHRQVQEILTPQQKEKIKQFRKDRCHGKKKGCFRKAGDDQAPGE